MLIDWHPGLLWQRGWIHNSVLAFVELGFGLLAVWVGLCGFGGVLSARLNASSRRCSVSRLL